MSSQNPLVSYTPEILQANKPADLTGLLALEFNETNLNASTIKTYRMFHVCYVSLATITCLL
ncbi:hypothetical protein MHLNE_16170 [Moorella humiferrea]